MAGDKSKSGHAASLQQRVEAVVQSEGRVTPGCSPDELSKLVQQLRAYQIELETRNEALARSTAQFDAIFNAMAEAVVFADTDRRIRAMNPAALRLWGYTLDELEGKTTACLYADVADYERQGRERYHVGAQPESQDYELWYRRKDGSIFLGESISTHVRDSEGNVLGFVGVVRDVTEHRQAEEALRLSEERFRAVFEEAASSIVVVDAETGGFVEFNDQAHRNLGYTREEFQKLTIADIDVVESAADVTRHIESVMKEGGDIFETKHRGKDGRTREILVSARALRLPGRSLFIGIWTDITERKQTEEKLHCSEQLFQQVIDASPACIFLKDKQGRYLLTNRANAELHALSPEQMIGATDRDFIELSLTTPEEVEHFLREDREVIETKRPKLIPEEPFTLPDGEVKWFQTVKVPFDTEEHPDCVLGVATDITERKRAEEALRASETNYREVFNAVNDALFIHDMATGKILDVNAAMCEMYGVTPEEARRMEVVDLSSGEPGYTQDDASCQIAKAASEGKNVFEWHAKRQSGELFWVEVSLQRAVIGGQDRILAVVRDITERKRADEALRRSEERFELAMRGANDGLWDYNSQTGDVYYSPRWKSMLGYAEHEIGNGPDDWASLLHPDDREQAVCDLDAFATGRERSYEAEYRMRHKDGHYVSVLSRGFAVRGDSGKATRIVGTHVDITERKRAEQALQQARNELEHRVKDRTKELVTVNARLREEIAERQQSEERERQLQADLAHVGRLTTMGEMASGLAHELNQPLAAISLQSEVITRTAQESANEVSDDLVRSLEFIAKQAYRAGDLIRRMREFVKHTAPKRVVISVAEIVDEVLLLAQRDLEESGIALEVEVDDPHLEIRADKVQLQQVLLNLIRNAIEAMETTEVDQRRLRIETRTRVPLLEVAVRDTGCGIPADKAERVDELFGTFYSTKSEGLGMGLAISRSIVESHGGRIWATPNPDRGTTFTFAVPIATEDRENETETPRICRR